MVKCYGKIYHKYKPYIRSKNMRCYVCGTSKNLISFAAYGDEDSLCVCSSCLGAQNSGDEEPQFDYSPDCEEIL
jgi:uncharacterized CHY-type Zn-finger protein